MRCVVIIPVGPNCQEQFVRDTLESVYFFLENPQVIVIDDSGKQLPKSLSNDFDFEIIAAEVTGLGGNLYRTISLGMLRALDLEFDVLIRLDTDALLTGFDLDVDARQFFSEHPDSACLGNYTVAFDLTVRNHEWARRQFLLALATALLSRPRRFATLVKLWRRAQRHGYHLGDSVMGGAAIYSRSGLEALRDAGYLDNRDLAGSHMEEDHIFGLAIRSLGLTLDMFGTAVDSLPMGTKWRGLPAAPPDLLALKKKIIHSVRFFEGLTEDEIREFFRLERNRLASSKKR